MNHFNMRLLCQTCSDKRSVNRAVADAKRISLRIMGLMEQQSNLKHRPQVASQLFHASASCRRSGSSCNRMATLEKELRRAEQELDKRFAIFRQYLEGIEEQKACSLRQQAFELLRGHYPQAAQLIKT